MQNKKSINQYRKEPILRFVFTSIIHFKFYIISLIFISALWSINVSLAPYLLKIMVNKIENIQYQYNKILMSSLILSVFWYIFLLFIIFCTSRVDDLIWLNLKPHLQKYTGIKLMNIMMNHSVELYRRHLPGSLVNKINDVINGIPEIIRICIHQLFGNTLALVFATYTLYQINFQFSIVFFLWAIFFIVFSVKLSATAKNLSQEVASIKSYLIGHKSDILSNITTVFLFSNQKKEKRGLIIVFDKLVSAMQKKDWFFLKMGTYQGVSFLVYQITCLCLLLTGLKKGIISSGDFILVLTMNISLVQILWTFSYYIYNLAETIGRVKQGLSITLVPINIQDIRNAKVLKISCGEVVFNAVSFRYKNSNALFDNLSIKISPYQKVGLVGYSGSGKTTFINLMLRLYDPIEGHIFIDNQNIKEVTLKSLRNLIGVIPQDPLLFNRSIKDNISYGKLDSTEKEIVYAAQKAEAHEFILRLPKGYDSLVGERGINLSGGQRQRIAIARIFLKNPPILIFDEATSQLDSITEKCLKDRLLEFWKNKTTLVIAHRLSTLINMDRILVFNQGKVVEDGNHETLLSSKGLYRAMWDVQNN